MMYLLARANPLMDAGNWLIEYKLMMVSTKCGGLYRRCKVCHFSAIASFNGTLFTSFFVLNTDTVNRGGQGWHHNALKGLVGDPYPFNIGHSTSRIARLRPTGRKL